MVGYLGWSSLEGGASSQRSGGVADDSPEIWSHWSHWWSHRWSYWCTVGRPRASVPMMLCGRRAAALGQVKSLLSTSAESLHLASLFPHLLLLPHLHLDLRLLHLLLNAALIFLLLSVSFLPKWQRTKTNNQRVFELSPFTP